MSDDKTSPRARDIIIRRLQERAHELRRRERLGLPMTAGQEQELSDVLTQIDKHEMDEYEENTGPYRRAQNAELVGLANKLRALVPAAVMVSVDAAIARLLKEPEPAEGKEPQ